MPHCLNLGFTMIGLVKKVLYQKIIISNALVKEINRYNYEEGYLTTALRGGSMKIIMVFRV